MELGHRFLDVAHNLVRLTPHVLGDTRRLANRHATHDHAVSHATARAVAADLDAAHGDA